MCRSYTLTKSAEQLESHFGIQIPEDYSPRYNARPSQLLPVLTQDNIQELTYQYWGTIPSWAKNKNILIN